MPDGDHAGGDRVEEAVRAVLASLTGDITAKEAALLAELEALGRMVAEAKAEIAALRVDDINASHIPAATDELDAVVEHTATATNEILDACEALERLSPSLPGGAGETVSAAVTRIYEACSFQDITGQRIGKVVTALKTIESRVQEVTRRFGGALPGGPRPAPPPDAPPHARTEGERLANGPQLPGAASSQAEIDALLASFD
ncbi:protein phosphatase CheZ [Roseomonas sp. OT10]|uniref:protein phosphatase CheZ n=1 Tax=Roseomonas cutis TaxID=2897332 RepID=UPI001E4E469D|nr:protein phosphatase CheZ [Roseomonas sp. OT10]UFN48660.1 protein phosphatase CheZ [Roseomonas sp. OT10]